MPPTLRVATDCSGIETPLTVLRRLGVPHRHLFSSDNSERCRRYISTHFSPEVLYTSVFERPLKWAERIDLYVAGPPCTSASSINVSLGERERDGAYAVGRNCFEFIAASQPTAFVVENVPRLRTVRGGTVLAEWLSLCEGLYDVEMRCLNARDYGCPQNRNRLFVVGVLRGNRKGWRVAWPESVPLTLTVDDLLDKDAPPGRPLSAWERKALAAFGGEGVLNTSTVGTCVRLGSPWVHRDPRVSTCLTSRHPDMYSTRHARRLAKHEYARLQGFRDGEVQLETPGILQLIGNAMNAQVLHALLSTLIPASR